MPFDPLSDWRVRPIATLKEAGVLPEGKNKRFPAGSVIVPINPLKGRGNHRDIHQEFIPIALALDIAVSASEGARQALGSIVFDERVNGKWVDRDIPLESTEQVMVYFEQSMIATAFSVQSIEIFCNDVIERMLTEPYLHSMRKGPKLLMPAAVQREASIDQKLLNVIPHLLSIKPPERKSRVWQDYVAMKKFRNDVIHPKGDHQARPRSPKHMIDDVTLWHELWNVDVRTFPRAAVAMISHFTPPADVPQWLQHCLDLYGIEPTPPGHRPRPNRPNPNTAG